jgi:hypothetical protein
MQDPTKTVQDHTLFSFDDVYLRSAHGSSGSRSRRPPAERRADHPGRDRRPGDNASCIANKALLFDNLQSSMTLIYSIV